MAELGQSLARLSSDRQDASQKDVLLEDSPALFMLDTNIFDKLLEEPPPFIDDLRRAVVDTGRMRLFITYIQEHELAAIPDAKRAKRISLLDLVTTISAEHVPAVSLYDVALFGQATYASEEDVALHEYLTSNPEQHGKDAAIIMSALQHELIVVSENEKDMPKFGARIGVTVWNYARFREHVGK